MTKKIKWLNILWWIFMSISLLVIVCVGGFLIRIHLVHKLDYREAISMVEYDYYPIRPSNWTEEEYIEIIEDLVGYDNYTLSKYDFKFPLQGRANLLTNHIQIDYNLSFNSFVFTFTHELIHLKYKSANERFTNYNAWLVLHESDNFYLKNIAGWYADSDLKGQVDYNYSCAGYIEEYLRSK